MGGLINRSTLHSPLTPDEELREIGEVAADLRLCLTEPLFIIVALIEGGPEEEEEEEEEQRGPACSKGGQAGMRINWQI